MSVLGWIGLGGLVWFVLGLVSIRVAARFGHIWGFHLRDPLLGRVAIIFQAPALILECAVMDHHYPDEDSLAGGAARLMVAKFREPQADLEALLEKLNERVVGWVPDVNVDVPAPMNMNENIVPAQKAAQGLNG